MILNCFSCCEAGGNPHIRLYEIANTEHQQPVLTLEGHTASVTSLGFQKEGRFLYSRFVTYFIIKALMFVV